MRRPGRRGASGAAMVAAALVLSACSATSVATGPGNSRGTDPYRVLLVPETSAGFAGWCIVAVGVPGGACGDGRRHGPVLEESWNSEDQPPRTIGIAVTTGEVAKVGIVREGSEARLLGGTSIATKAEPGFPEGLRAVVAVVNGQDLLQQEAASPSTRPGLPRFVPLTAGKVVIPEAAGERAPQLIRRIPTRRVADPARPAQAICDITAEGGTTTLTADSGSVITEVHRYSGFVGDGFITCADTTYELAGWPLEATVLLSASHPGASPPSLMGMRPLRGEPGVFAAPGTEDPTGTEGAQYARRIPGAWLIVSRAKPPQRLALLKRLRVELHITHSY